MNVLITSCGRRVKVVEYFKKELESVDGKIIVTDLDYNAPALYFSDFHYTVSEIYSENYIGELINICKKHNITTILSLIDPELEILAKHKSIFEDMGVSVIVSDLEMITMCFDKYEAFNYFCQHQLPTVPTYIDKSNLANDMILGKISFPIIAKPRKGSASIGIVEIHNEMELDKIENPNGQLLFQPFYKDEEYGVDAYIDLISGELVNMFIKKKLRMRSGETDKSISIHDARIESLVVDLIHKTNFKGPIDIDIFEYKGDYYISEINPRFGGGYPHAFECGVNFPKYIMRNLQGLENEAYEGVTYDENKVMMKYDTVVMQ